MQLHPEIEPNLRNTVRTIVGPSFTDRELLTIQERALNEAEMKDLEVLQGIRAGAPVYLTPPPEGADRSANGIVGRGRSRAAGSNRIRESAEKRPDNRQVT